MGNSRVGLVHRLGGHRRHLGRSSLSSDTLVNFVRGFVFRETKGTLKTKLNYK